MFNDEWLVIALHHAGGPDPDDVRKFIANEGIRISSIIKFLTVQKLLPGEKELIDNLIKSISKGPGLDVAPKSRKMLIKELNPEWYEGATGYDPNFLSDSREIPLPKLSAALEKDALPVKTGGKVLHYTHFSIVMSKSRRLALYTAVNIDGNKLLALKRAKDKWYFDPRIDSKYQCGPALYDTNDLDRGHLVRRLDPVWGELAGKANEDTFHFTNCAPQHKNFNQKTWQELEDYILNNSRNHQLKVSVFTGPVFRSDDVVYRDQFQIPAEFWKVAGMGKEDDMLSATAYLQTQKNLIHDLEFAYGQYKTYQVPITKIENITGLDFGNLRNYDPLGRTEAVVGHIIEKQEDIKI